MKVRVDGNNYYVFCEEGFGITIDLEENWELSNAPSQTRWHGKGAKELMELLSILVESYNLKWYSKATRDTIVIYTNNLLKVKGLFREYNSTDFADFMITIFDYFQFRDISRWKDLDDSLQIAEYAQYMIDTLFIPERYFYITPNQVPRRALKQTCNDNTATIVFPDDFDEYSLFRKALFGGIVYVPYKNFIVNDPVICLDLTSAYIYDLLIEKHVSSPLKRQDTNNWKYFLDSKSETSIGKYIIKYSCPHNKIRCFKNINGKHFESGIQEEEVIFTAIDLALLCDLANVMDIKCEWLYSYEVSTLPKYMLDEIVKQYIKKVDLKNDEAAYNLQKPIVNGIFGDCIRNYDEHTFYRTKKSPTVAPQWGIWCCAYARKNLLKLANIVEGWVYSDTDSIYCFDTEENLKLVEAYNEKARIKVKAFCDLYGYNYEKLKDLGTFKVEKHIKRFRAISQKTYMYETTDGQFKLTAAGLNQKTIEVSKELFNVKHLNYGSRLHKWVDENGYHEEWLHGEENLLLESLICKEII